MTPPRLHITGASCTGTTTLGVALARRLGLPHLDTDDYYWAPVDPPFSQKRPPEDRVRLMRADQGAGGWVLSGSLMGWGEPALLSCELILFLTAPWEVRRSRLIAREQARFGDRITPGGDMRAIHTGFLDWASRYDDPAFTGRSRARHEDWLSRQKAPVLRLDATRPISDLIDDVLNTPL
ncbi:adenylate kinase [Aliiroseovarius sp.]|uniref:adenylate kinase n=1 Tax=Aliiroseovarius sp. TaxID=1872442 RepID=UPI003BAC3AA1